MEISDSIYPLNCDDGFIFDSLFDFAPYDELPSEDFSGCCRDWLDDLINDSACDKNEHSSLFAPSHLDCDVSVQSEHSYSLTSAHGLSSTVTDKSDIDEYIDGSFNNMDVINPNLAMVSDLSAVEDDVTISHDGIELDSTIDDSSELLTWGDSSVSETESADSVENIDVTDEVYVVSSEATVAPPTAVVVTCDRKITQRRPTIILARPRHPITSSAYVASVSQNSVVPQLYGGDLRRCVSQGSSVLLSVQNRYCHLSSDGDTNDNDVERMPPTPPGSSSSSESEGSHSPKGSAPSSPQQRVRPHQQTHSGVYYGGLSTASAGVTTGGVLTLTDEEKRTLIAEGYSVPTRLPLSKQDERNLKKVQRKIKNKLSAQESRRKKKDYVDSLEKQLEASNHENNQLKEKMDTLEADNRRLMQKLQKLQSIANSVSPKSPVQPATCLMVCVLFFAVCFGIWSPSQLGSAVSQYRPQLPVVTTATSQLVSDSDYHTPSVKSRTLFSFADDPPDGAIDTTSCVYHGAVLDWLTGSCRAVKSNVQHAVDDAALHEVPSRLDQSVNMSEVRVEILSMGEIDVAYVASDIISARE